MSIANCEMVVFEANTRNKKENTTWKAMKNWTIKCYIFLCNINFEVTWPFWKMWPVIVVLSGSQSVVCYFVVLLYCICCAWKRHATWSSTHLSIFLSVFSWPPDLFLFDLQNPPDLGLFVDPLDDEPPPSEPSPSWFPDFLPELFDPLLVLPPNSRLPILTTD